MAKMVLRPMLVGSDVSSDHVLQLVRLHAPDAELLAHEAEPFLIRAPGGMTDQEREGAERDLSDALGQAVSLEPNPGPGPL